MLELYQSEDCPDCTRVRARLAALKIPYVVRSVPMDRARRERVIEAGGRPDIPLLVDPERGRTTYEADEIVLQLGETDFYPQDETPDEDLPQLFQTEGEPASDAARRILDRAGEDYVVRPVAPGTPGTPRVVRPSK